jgi:hypothetical protein
MAFADWKVIIILAHSLKFRMKQSLFSKIVVYAAVFRYFFMIGISEFFWGRET